MAVTGPFSFGSGDRKQTLVGLSARATSFGPSPASPTFTFRATISVTNCLRRWLSLRRAISLLRSCAAPGRRNGTDAVHAVELPSLRRGVSTPRPTRHLDE